jgi:hypothetical protein
MRDCYVVAKKLVRELEIHLGQHTSLLLPEYLAPDESEG